MTNKYLAFVFVYFLFYIYSNGQQYTINDKTKYYVKDVENFNNYSSNGWDLLEDKQLKIIAKALNIKTDEAKKIITSTRKYNQPKNKRNKDVAYIMYKVCELNGYTNGGFKYTRLDDVLCLMYVPNDLNTHLPADKLAENGKGFFQITHKESISTTPLSSDYYKPMVSLKDENYSFGFRFGAKDTDSLVVQKIIKSSPAEKAGLKVDDIIVEYNGQNVKYKSIIDASKIFKESGFTNNTFKILRNNTMQSITMDKVNAKTLEFVCVSTNCDNGNCVIENINGYTIKGNFKDGNIIGNAIFTAEDGFVFYEGPVKKLSSDFTNYNFVKHGFGKEKFRNGNSFEGNYAYGEKEGNGVIIYADGTQKKGIWKDDKYYDEISIGFDEAKIKTFISTPKYLYEQNQEFITNANQLTFEDKSIEDFKKDNGLSNLEFDKLMKLCDFKYKPANLNTPSKLKNLINDNQEKYPYSIFSMGYLKATTGNYYAILRMPEDLNRWLPETMRFNDVNALYFLAPYDEVQGMSYLTYLDLKKQKEAAESWKKTEEKNAANLSAYWNEKSKNEYKGIAVYQFSYWNYNQRREDYDYAFVSAFGPPGQELSNSDYIAMDKLVGASGDKIAMEFFKGKDESYAEEFAASKTGIHRYSITKRYNYYMPQKSNSSSASYSQKYSNEEIKKIDKELEEANKKVKQANQDLLDNKTTEKVEMRKKIAQEIFTTNGNIINEPTKVQVIDILTSDKYYTENKKFIGKNGTVEGALVEDADGTYHGTIKFVGEKYSTLFYKVNIKIINE